jgi:hypothetical protein
MFSLALFLAQPSILLTDKFLRKNIYYKCNVLCSNLTELQPFPNPKCRQPTRRARLAERDGQGSRGQATSVFLYVESEWKGRRHGLKKGTIEGICREGKEGKKFG